MATRQAHTVTTVEKVRFLEQPGSYPEPTSTVCSIETHMSWVFVCDTLVYKMKKPVRLPFLDFSTLERRGYFCQESIRLNRRLAPSVYLGVVPLTLDRDQRLHVQGTGEAVEWLEKMRRLPGERMLDRAISRGTVTPADVRRFATVLARFYRRAAPEPMAPETFRRRLLQRIDDNEQALEAETFNLDRARLSRVSAAQRAFVNAESALLEDRLAAGRVLEAHGDLRPEHVALLEEPVFIDCLEFNRDFRVMDVAEELSYLAMECAFAGASFVGPLLFETYRDVTGDRVPDALIGFYESLRALLRAKLAVGHLPDYPATTHPKWLRLAAHYLEMAQRRLPS